jgi:hypothetical protein
LTTEIETSKNEFVLKFKEQVDEGSTGTFSNLFEVFSSSKTNTNDLQGLIASTSREGKVV